MTWKLSDPTMIHRTSAHRLLASMLSTTVLTAMFAFPSNAMAAEGDVTYELRPHCEEKPAENGFGGPSPDVPFMTRPMIGSCHNFEIKDPQTRQTPFQKPEDILDMDLIVHNPQSLPITRVRAWLAYDPTILEGRTIELNPAFNLPTPNEQVFTVNDGYGKIGASTNSPPNEQIVVVARIKMKIRQTSAIQTIISFFHPTGDIHAETVIVTKEGNEEKPLLHPPVGSLLVRLGKAPLPASSSSSSEMPPEPPPVSSASSSTSVAPIPSSSSSSVQMSSVTSSSSSAQAIVGVAFKMLQIQHLRVTTEDTTAYLAWDPLASSELAGYNAYYGTISGDYIQRRSVDKSSTTVAIRNLVIGTRYFFAVRGFNADGTETEFSQEVAVTIGSPETSTSPLTAAASFPGPNGRPPRTGGTVAGATGPSSIFLLTILLSAGIGTLIASRRQFIIHPR